LTKDKKQRRRNGHRRTGLCCRNCAVQHICKWPGKGSKQWGDQISWQNKGI